MYSLNRLILIDSYKPGELVEVRLDGHTNLNGVNGSGKIMLPLKHWRSIERIVLLGLDQITYKRNDVLALVGENLNARIG